MLLNAVQGISELITKPGLINVDFADVRTVMSEMGLAMMGSGAATGETRARDAAESAINSPLLEDVDLSGAKGILVNITAGMDLTIGEFDEVGMTVKEFADDDATVVVGTVIDPEMREELRVTVVATGLGGEEAALHKPKPTGVSPVKPVRMAGVDNTRTETPPAGESLDIPTTIRRNPQATQAVARSYVEAAENQDMDYLDIPAFLRRQAD